MVPHLLYIIIFIFYYLSVLFQVPDINIDELEFDFEMDIEEEDPVVCNHIGHLPQGN